jgi:hypothetical protein
MKIGKFRSEKTLEHEVIVFQGVSTYLLKSTQAIAKLVDKQQNTLQSLQSVICILNIPWYKSNTSH